MNTEIAVALVTRAVGTIAPPGPKDASIGDLIGLALRMVIIVAGLWAFVKIIQGAFKIMSSSGDPQKVAEGRMTIMYALIGIIVVLASWGMIVLVEQIFNIGLGFSKPIEF